MPANSLNYDIKQALDAAFMAVRDPGNGGTVTYDLKGLAICRVSTSGAETRVLPTAAAHSVGEKLTVIFTSDGGDLTITGSDQSIVLEDAGDTVEFTLSDAAGSKVWRVTSDSRVGFTGLGGGATLVVVEDPDELGTMAYDSATIAICAIDTTGESSPIRVLPNASLHTVGERLFVTLTAGDDMTLSNYLETSEYAFSGSGQAMEFVVIDNGGTKNYVPIGDSRPPAEIEPRPALLAMHQLARIRGAIIQYAVDNAGAYPGADADPDTLKSDISPYLNGVAFPTCTVGAQNDVIAIDLGSGAMSGPTTPESEAWKYQVLTGRIIINYGGDSGLYGLDFDEL